MIDRVRFANAALYALATAIFVATIVVVYLLVAPIRVLNNWRIIAPEGQFKIGDTIVVQSLFNKTREVDGMAHRTLICSNSSGAEVAYPINDAIANHQAQNKAGVGIPITIPLIVTPSVCKLAISIEYKVYPFRTVTEYTTSNLFKVVK